MQILVIIKIVHNYWIRRFQENQGDSGVYFNCVTYYGITLSRGLENVNEAKD